MSVKEKIVQKASTLGFDACRTTTVAPPQSAGQFQAWLAARCHGEMGYLERSTPKRLNPQLLLPGAQSLITLGASYAVPAETTLLSSADPKRRQDQHSVQHPNCKTLKGLIARYARFNDYHEVLGSRLDELTAFVTSLGGPGTRAFWWVDTGPLLERDLAQRAGLGFIGKHTNLINRRLGNWLFLAEIITTINLPPDIPETNRCGTCTRCLVACPTRAITAPYQLDARRCISYLTIELKTSIPEEYRPAIGRRIFGCDDCLAVCPWNRFAREGRLMRNSQRPDLAEPDLLPLLALNEKEFREQFQGTPILRSKRRGFLRNVCVALGNVGTPTALPALRTAAHHPDSLIAEHARWAITQIETRYAGNRA